MNLRHSLLAVLLLAAAASAAAAFWRFSVERDYLVVADVPCDPAQHSCYVGDGETAPQFYAVVSKRASRIPACDGWAGQCRPLSCTDADGAGCSESFCEENGQNTCYQGPLPAATGTDTN